MIRIAWLFSIPGEDKYYCSLDREFSLGGNTYEPLVFQVSGIQLGDSISPVDITIPLGDSDLRAFWLGRPGFLPAELQMLYWGEDNDDWQVGPVYKGHLSQPEIEEGEVSVSIDRNLNLETLIWSNESQVARFPTDVGFNQIAVASRAGGVDSTWP